MKLAALISTAALASLLALPAFAAAEGVPDFYANGQTWSNDFGPQNGYSGKNFDPPPPGAPGAKGPIGNHPDYPAVGNGTPGQASTFRIGNDLNPLLQPWAAQVMKQIRLDVVEHGMQPYDPSARCWPAGVPGVITFANQPTQILQTPHEVVMLYDRGQVTRHILMDKEHSKNPHPSWYGESVGHYENGDTLVIDTIGFNDKTTIDTFNVPHSKKLHVVERYQLIDGGNHIQLTMTIDDPVAFTQTWSAGKTMSPGNAHIGETLCQVHNDDYFNQGLVPVPTAGTPDF